VTSCPTQPIPSGREERHGIQGREGPGARPRTWRLSGVRSTGGLDCGRLDGHVGQGREEQRCEEGKEAARVLGRDRQEWDREELLGLDREERPDQGR
jgi:hypothetical protein